MNRYELISIQCDEGYESLGSFPSKEKAVQELADAIGRGDPSTVTDVYDDTISFSVLEHEDGWGGPNYVHTEQWIATYQDGSDDPSWNRVKDLKEVVRSS